LTYSALAPRRQSLLKPHLKGGTPTLQQGPSIFVAQKEEGPMVLRIGDPFATLLSVQRAMDNAMQRDWFGPLTSGRGAYPPVNVFERGEDFEIVAELPGVKKEDLDIQVKGATVRIHGKKTVEYSDEASAHRRERVGGEFDRTLTLPALIDADYRDGVLTLKLPRAESERPRSVTIN
jgi:HSP20 family protein